MSEFGKDLGDYFCKFTFGQFVTLILLELVTLFLVFYLGARYGPDLMGRSDTVARVSNEKDSPAAEKERVDYTFPETLTAPPGREAIQIKPSGLTAREFEKQVAENSPIIIPAPEPVEPPSKLEEKAEIAIPVTTAVAGDYSVQVGSYATAGEAKGQIDKWRNRGYSSFMTVADIPKKGTWYRVRVGHFKNRGEAESFLQKFRSKEKVSGLVVRSGS